MFSLVKPLRPTLVTNAEVIPDLDIGCHLCKEEAQWFMERSRPTSYSNGSYTFMYLCNECVIDECDNTVERLAGKLGDLS